MLNPNIGQMMASTGDDVAVNAAKENDPFHVPTIGEAVEAGDDDGEFAGVDEIAGSMCMVCGGGGTTRLFTTKIPFFREIILSSFECDQCLERNNEVRKSAVVIVWLSGARGL